MAEYSGETPSTEEQCSQGDLLNIFNTLGDLEKAKTVLQSEYDELLEEHQCAEDKMKNLRAKLSETSERYMKRQEVQNISKLKRDSVVTKAKCMEERCHELRDKIFSLQGELEKEKQLQLNSLENFEAQMKELKELFLKAVSFYSKNGLETEFESAKEQTTAYQEQAGAVKCQLTELEEQLSALSLSANPLDLWEEKIPINDRALALSLLSKEQQALQEEVNRLKEVKEKTLTDLSSSQQDNSIQG